MRVPMPVNVSSLACADIDPHIARLTPVRLNALLMLASVQSAQSGDTPAHRCRMMTSSGKREATNETRPGNRTPQ
jgi:hypothetical protein